MQPARQHYTIVGIIAAAAAVFIAQQFADATMVRWLSVAPAEVRDAWAGLVEGSLDSASARRFATLFTAALLHADFEHILYNMVFLWVFGALASQHVGPWWALAVFVVTAVSGNATQVALNPESWVPVLGASGGVCGFEGFYLGLALRYNLDWPDVWPLAHPIPPLQLAAFGVLGFVFDAYALMNHQQGVAYGAHLGGFVAGALMAGLVQTVYPRRADLPRRPQ